MGTKGSESLRPFGFLVFVRFHVADDEFGGDNAEVSIGKDEGVALGVFRHPSVFLGLHPWGSAGVRFEQLLELFPGQRLARLPWRVGSRHVVRMDKTAAAP